MTHGRRASGPSHREGQLWSGDLAISVLIFTVVCVIAYTLLSNTIVDTDFSMTRSQASTAAELLMRDGYPQHWVASDVIKAGIVSESELSLRKVRELALLEPTRLRTRLRLTSHVLVYFTNSTNATLGVTGDCVVTDAPSRVDVERNDSITVLPAISLAGRNHSVSDLLVNVSPSVSYVTAMESLQQQEVVLMEDGIINASSAALASIRTEAASMRGMTFIVVGDPGTPVLGVAVNATPATSITLVGSAGTPLGFASNDNLAVTGTIPTIESPDSDLSRQGSVRNITVIARADSGKIAYATWLYNDARVWYFATAVGTTGSGIVVKDIIANLTRSSIETAWPACGEPTITGDPKQVAAFTRSLPYHGAILTMHVVVWRDS